MRRLKSSLAYLLLPFLFLPIGGCPSDTTPVETSAGVRPAGEVKTIDSVADTIASLDAIHRAAVLTHDAKAGQEDPVAHAKRRKLLVDMHDGLQASYRLLAQIKRGELRGSPTAALVPLLTTGRAFLPIAVDLGAVPQATADALMLFLLRPTP